MADSWVVTPTSVTKNGSAITGYVSHALLVRNNTESKAFVEVSLAVRIIDPKSEAMREAPLSPLSAAEQALVMAAYAQYPSYSEWRSKPGDTITFSGTVTEAAGIQPAGTLAGTSAL